MIIDTHSHIYAEQFDADREDVIRRAIENGVTRFILPAIDSQTHKSMFDVANLFEHHYPTIGVHPTSVKVNFEEELDIALQYLTTEKDRIVAIGEIGLDYYWDMSFQNQQHIALRRQLEWALQHNLPAIVHTRDAYPDMLNVLRDYRGSKLRVLFHGYSGTIKEAEDILSQGEHLLGIGGVVTFKKSELYTVVKSVGIENIVLETDAPYLAPAPFRGKRNESSYIPHIIECISSFMNVDRQEIENITTNNAIRLFNLRKYE